MSFETKYSAVLDKLIAKVKGVVTETVLGEKTKVETFPVAFVLPRPDAITDRSIKTTEHSATFEVVVMDRHEDTEAGLRSVITLGAKIFDTLNSDRTLSGEVECLVFDEFSPDFEVGPSFALHWSLLRVSCRFKV